MNLSFGASAASQAAAVFDMYGCQIMYLAFKTSGDMQGSLDHSGGQFFWG